MAKAIKQSGGSRIKEQGKSLIWVTLDPEEKEKVRVAAALEDVPMSEFLKLNGLKAAGKILKNRMN